MKVEIIVLFAILGCTFACSDIEVTSDSSSFLFNLCPFAELEQPLRASDDSDEYQIQFTIGGPNTNLGTCTKSIASKSCPLGDTIWGQVVWYPDGYINEIAVGSPTYQLQNASNPEQGLEITYAPVPGIDDYSNAKVTYKFTIQLNCDPTMTDAAETAFNYTFPDPYTATNRTINIWGASAYGCPLSN